MTCWRDEERDARRIAPFGRCFTLALLCAAAVISFSACRRDRSLSSALESGTIRIGYSVEPPYSDVTPEGSVTGLFPEMARIIAGELGIARIEWRQAEFGNLIDELRSGEIDVIAVGMFITPERERLVDFSLPAAQAAQGLLVLRGNPHQLHSYDDAAANGATVAFLPGSVEEGLLRTLGARPEKLIAVPDARAGRIAVESGTANALALTAPTIRQLERRGEMGRTEAASPFAQPPAHLREGLGLSAFAFRNGGSKLREAWNAELQALLASPEYPRLLQQFAFVEEEAVVLAAGAR